MSTKPPTAQRRPFLSLRWKLVIGFTLVFTVVFAGAYYWFYFFSTERALERIRTDLQDTLQGAAAGIDGESMRILAEEGEVNEEGFSDHELYLEQMAWFETVQSLEPRAWPYTYVAGPEPNTIYALADLWAIHDPSKSYAFGETSVSSGPLRDGLNSLSFNVPRDRRCGTARETYAGEFLGAVRGQLAYAGCLLLRRVGYTDSYGSWVSAYMPVLDTSGQRAGGIGIDFEMAYVDQVQDAILGRTVHAFTITYLTLLLLVMFMARYVTSPITRLTDVAERVGAGSYDQDFSKLRGGLIRDEIGLLSEVFEAMTEQVRHREQTLRHEVRQLRIEIDEGKRTQEVQQIVETDFFRDLQAKAQRFRDRKYGEAATESSE